MVFVGEGEAEKAFLQHLKSLYGVGSLKVSPKSAGGKGPDNVINDAIGTLENSKCDTVAVLLDTDIPWPPKLKKKALKLQIILIGSTPYLEGLLLDILGEKHPTPSNNKTCKAALHPRLSGKATQKESYQGLFDKARLDEAQKRVPELKQIVDLINNTHK
ncbi:MAG: hypothetical protein ACI9FJ_001629 [Alteromonadaceae bacterium]|jgi:hypothetical protein